MVRVKRVRYGEGNPAAGVSDRVTGWELWILEEKAGKKIVEVLFLCKRLSGW